MANELENFAIEYYEEKGNAGHTLRIDCPSCGGTNSFAIVKYSKVLHWWCYRLSCQVRGHREQVSSSNEIRDKLKRYRGNNKDLRGNRKMYTIPEYFLPITLNTDCINYLEKYNCFEGYLSKRFDVRYDPKENRIVYLLNEGQTTFGACGRLLKDVQGKSKWHRYDKEAFHFHAPSKNATKTVIVVEDCTSAANVSNIVDSIALLGTTIQIGTLLTVSELWHDAIIMLDPDAKQRSLNLAQELGRYIPTTTRFPNCDPKDLSIEAIRKLVYS